MRTTQVRELTTDDFLPFGFYAHLIDPAAARIGEPPIEFFRDMVQQQLGGPSAVSFSTCRVEKRDPIVDVSEYHTQSGEGILPLDNDVLIHVGPATPDATPPLDDIAVFRVPRGTMVVLRPGVWHHAPFALHDQPANVLIVLPERTYANDCQVVTLDAADAIRIEL